MAAVNIIPVKYVDDYGNNFQMGLDATLYNQATVAGTSDLGGPIPPTGVTGLQALPSSVIPRRIFMKNPAGKGRYVPVLTPTARAATTAAQELSIEDSADTPSTFTRVGAVRGEYFGKHYTP